MHLKEYVARLPPETINDVQSAVNYVRDLHEHVNVLTGKRAIVVPPPPVVQVAPHMRPGRRVIGARTRIAAPRAPRAVAAPRLRKH